MEQSTSPPQDRDTSIVAAILQAVDKHLIGPAGEMLDATFIHGPVAAFLRQGTDELGMALKAFPDSIQTHEPGSVFNPLFSDIANNRRPDAAGQGQDVPSVSDILASPQDYISPEQTGGPDNQQQRGMSM